MSGPVKFDKNSKLGNLLDTIRTTSNRGHIMLNRISDW